MPAARLDHTVHPDRAVLHEQLGFAAGLGGASQLEECAERERAADDDVGQLLRRIGMMR